MFHLKKVSAFPKIATYVKTLTTTEITTALKPFYFSVHPDLFGQYPDQRKTNEQALKQLSLMIENLQAHKPIAPTYLQFFLRDKVSGGHLRLVKIYINQHDVRGVVSTILKSCGLSTDHVDKISSMKDSKKTNILYGSENLQNNKSRSFSWDYMRDTMATREVFRLEEWLAKNHGQARYKFHSTQHLKDEFKKLCKEVTEQWGLLEVKWNCGWNEAHLRGCLLSFKALAEQHPDPVRLLKGRVLVFAQSTGVSLDGHIMLNSGEVRHNWLDLIKNVHSYDAVLSRLPAFEKSVSQVLRNIRVGRRKFMPKTLADQYEQNLLQITTSIGDYLTTRKFPKEWPVSMENYELVIETEAGPLMVSPTGQFITPSSIPGFMLINFITNNLQQADHKMKTYIRDKHTESKLYQECLKSFELHDLRKDDNITPGLMIHCCQQLLQNRNSLYPFLNGTTLHVTTYYSVLADGVVCIPWNFKI